MSFHASHVVAWNATYFTIAAGVVTFLSANGFRMFYPNIYLPRQLFKDNYLVIPICSWVSFVTAVLMIGVSITATCKNRQMKNRYEAQRNTSPSSRSRNTDFRTEVQVIRALSLGFGIVYLVFTFYSYLLAQALYVHQIIEAYQWFPFASHMLNMIAATITLVLMQYYTLKYVKAIGACRAKEQVESAVNPEPTSNGDERTSRAMIQEPHSYAQLRGLDDEPHTQSSSDGEAMPVTRAVIERPLTFPIAHCSHASPN